MSKTKKLMRYLNSYLSAVESQNYADLKECIESDLVWTDGHARLNPTAYELFASHEHFDLTREDIFKFSGIALGPEAFEEPAKAVERIWQKRLPELFPGYEFIIYKDHDCRQLAFCRKRTGDTDDPDEIITCLAHKHRNVRWNALLSAALFPHPKLVPHLIKQLDDKNPFNVLRAIIALGASKDEKVIEVLQKRFLKLERNPDGKYFVDDFLAYDLFKSLLNLGNEGYKLVFGLFKNYQNIDTRTLEYLCELIGGMSSPEALEIMLEIYFGQPEAAECVLTGLLRMEKEAFPRIIPHLSAKSPETRQKAIFFLANCFLKEARKHLVQGLQDRNRRVREAAVYGISRFYHRTRRELLQKALQDRALSVRVKAVEALGSLNNPRLFRIIQVLCQDKCPHMRRAAIRAVVSLGSKTGMNFLSNLYDNSSRQDRLVIIDSLYDYTGRDTYLKPLITKALASGDRQITRAANTLIEMM
ncbi:MAG: hypothetical protein CVV03_07925 [Firmicutes bacterium HGW-Firmicutes-8]|nr:MAG: hypothetical protein CVV03_07925 [Firmicutes bacterium HGW-Firmicutes-8]